MESYKVPEPIINSPFEQPNRHWYIREGEPPELRDGRRPSVVYPPRDERKERYVPWTATEGILQPSSDYSPAFGLVLVKMIDDRGNELQVVEKLP